MNNLKDISFLVIDVDGTMTNGGIYYDEHGNELKKFSSKDAAGFFAAHEAGIKIIVLTGRNSAATEKRMLELKVDYLCQNVKDKKQYLYQIMMKNSIFKENIGYIGDDLNDLSAMMLAGFIGCPFNSCREVKDKADYISSLNGGDGAVRDIIEYILKERNEWDAIVSKIYGFGF